MATLPWTVGEHATPAADAVVLGSRLELRAYRHVPALFLAAMKLRRHLRSTPGAVGVSLVAEVGSKTFWTLSAWSDRAALDAFVRAEPHATVMRRFGRRLARAAFDTWTCAVSDLPSPRSNADALWREARGRLVPPSSQA